MAAWIWVIIIIVAVIIIAAIILAALRKRRTAKLRDRFGPEYDQAVESRSGRRAAEAELRNREKEHSRLTIRELPEPARQRYAEQWRQLQEQFVDQPANTLVQADTLVRSVMTDEGYPMDDFNAQADLISVEHPHIVSNYRSAHAVCERAQTNQASTEEMRAALLNYRALFDELLSPRGGGAQTAQAGGPVSGDGTGTQQQQPMYGGGATQPPAQGGSTQQPMYGGGATQPPTQGGTTQQPMYGGSATQQPMQGETTQQPVSDDETRVSGQAGPRFPDQPDQRQA